MFSLWNQKGDCNSSTHSKSLNEDVNGLLASHCSQGQDLGRNTPVAQGDGGLGWLLLPVAWA